MVDEEENPNELTGLVRTLQANQERLQANQERMGMDHNRRQCWNMIYSGMVFTFSLGVVFVVLGNQSYQDQMVAFVGDRYPWLLATLFGGSAFAFFRESFKKIDQRLEKMDQTIDQRFEKMDQKFEDLRVLIISKGNN